MHESKNQIVSNNLIIIFFFLDEKLGIPILAVPLKIDTLFHEHNICRCDRHKFGWGSMDGQLFSHAILTS